MLRSIVSTNGGERKREGEGVWASMHAKRGRMVNKLNWCVRWMDVWLWMDCVQPKCMQENFAIIGQDNPLKINKQLMNSFKSISLWNHVFQCDFVKHGIENTLTTVQLRFNILARRNLSHEVAKATEKDERTINSTCGGRNSRELHGVADGYLVNSCMMQLTLSNM